MTRSSSTLFAAPDILQRRTLRLLDGDIAAKFMTSVLNLPRVRNLFSSDHFSVDATLIEAGASMKSFAPKDEDGKPPQIAARWRPTQRRARFPRREALE